MNRHIKARQPLYVDGVLFETTVSARKFLKVYSPEQNEEFMEAKKTGGFYFGHFISFEPGIRIPEKKEAARIQATQETDKGEDSKSLPYALLRGHCTHRLGSYTGGQW